MTTLEPSSKDFFDIAGTFGNYWSRYGKERIYFTINLSSDGEKDYSNSKFFLEKGSGFASKDLDDREYEEMVRTITARVNRQYQEASTQLQKLTDGRNLDGLDFLPTSDYIEAFRDEAQKILLRQTVFVQSNKVFILDVIDEIVRILKVSEGKKGKEEIQQIIEQTLQCPIWHNELDHWVWLSDLTVQGAIEQIDAWAKDNQAWSKVAQTIEQQAEHKLASESDLEDALQWVEATEFSGSEKQVRWAKSIALKNLPKIVELWKANQEVPSQASWWIDNR